MHTDVETNYKLSLTAAELRVIGLALAGKIKDASDVKAAKTLNVMLCEQRDAKLAEQRENAAHALRLAIKESEAP